MTEATLEAAGARAIAEAQMPDGAPMPDGATREPTRICGLLYCGPAAERHVNLEAGMGDPLAVYVRNALTLARSLTVLGQRLTLVTNDAARLATLIAHEGGEDASIELAEVAFTLDVPRGIPFESCHYRLELHRMLGDGLFGDFPALIDLDAVMLRPQRLPVGEALWVYDVTVQEWAGRVDPCARASFALLAGHAIDRPHWFGGEFFAGSARHFAELWHEVERIWPRYRDNWRTIYRPGDEMIHSTAFNLMAARGVPLRDAGAAGLVARWWSVRTTHPMAPLSHAGAAAMLHLPADKALLADHARAPFEPDAFIDTLRGRTRARQRAQRLRGAAQWLRGRRHAPDLT